MTNFLPLLPVKRLLLLLLAGIASIGYAQWEADPAYITTEVFQQVYLTDEGLYLKPAMSVHRTGQLQSPRDISPAIYTTPVHIWLVTQAARIAGPHWYVARWVSIMMTWLAVVGFWSVCRTRIPAPVAGLAALAMATNFMFLHAGRLATADPTALGFCCLSLWIWAVWRHTPAGLTAALIAALLATWTKPTCAPLLAGIGVTEVISAWQQRRQGWRAVWMPLAILAAGAATHLALFRYQMSLLAPTFGLTHPQPKTFSISFGTGIRHMFDSFAFAMPILPAATAMLAAAVFGFFLQPRERRRELVLDPLFQLCAIWIFTNTFLVGFITLHGARYYFGTIPAWTYLAFRIMAWDGKAYAARLGWLLVLANLAVQVPFYYLWLTQNPRQTYIAISRDIARRVTENHPGGAQLLGHGISEWVEWFDTRVQARAIGYRSTDRVDPLEKRVDYWRPEYLLVNDDDIWSNSEAIENLRKKCEPFWAGMDLVAEYRLLFRNIYPNSPAIKPNLKLYRMRYHGRTGPPAEKETGKPPIYEK